MKKSHLIATLGAAALLCSCIPSVNPFYTDKDVVFDARLPGVWRESGGKDQSQPEVWKFEKSGDKAYKLVVTDKDGKQGQFDAHLFKLKQENFLDLIPGDCDYATNQADLVAFAMFPGHLLVRVPQLGPELKLAFFNFDWLEKYLKQNPGALAHHTEVEPGKDSGRIVLTAGTRDLQRFVLKHLGEGELFDKPGILTRQTNTVSATAQPVSQ